LCECIPPPLLSYFSQAHLLAFSYDSVQGLKQEPRHLILDG